MRIAMIGQKGIPAFSGGVERHVEEIAKRLVKLGHQVTVYCRSTYNDARPVRYEGVNLRYIITVKNKNLEAVIYAVSASLIALFGQYDLLHYHAIGPASVSFIPRLLGKKVLVTVHGLDWQRDKWGGLAKAYLKWGEKATGLFPQKIISVSENLKTYFTNVYRKKPGEVVFIPNGVAVKPEVGPDRIKSYGLTKDSFLLFLARIVPEKGLHYLLEAYQKVKTDKKLVIAGGSSYTDAYLNQIKQAWGEDPGIIFTGEVKGRLVDELYSNAYLYILPSDLEGMPLTLLEAMSFGKGCLVSDIPENLGVIKEGYGFSFAKSNVIDLTEKLAFLLSNPDLVAAVGKKAREAVRKSYNWDLIAKETEEAYRSLLADKLK